mmetsp:Transcript_1553/g.3516  ORF Transcript_1553/g.3516 Transcript_1553/m.3516 type:complete len:214 (-) Transcript_1553:638-1279(-)
MSPKFSSSRLLVTLSWWLLSVAPPLARYSLSYRTALSSLAETYLSRGRLVWSTCTMHLSLSLSQAMAAFLALALTMMTGCLMLLMRLRLTLPMVTALAPWAKPWLPKTTRSPPMSSTNCSRVSTRGMLPLTSTSTHVSVSVVLARASYLRHSSLPPGSASSPLTTVTKTTRSLPGRMTLRDSCTARCVASLSVTRITISCPLLGFWGRGCLWE